MTIRDIHRDSVRSLEITARADDAQERNTMATYIPLSWNDPLFSDNVNSGSVTVPKGGTLSNVSITQTGSIASVVLAGGATLDDIRISSREGVRIGGSGNITINDAWIEATGQSGDHADGIQAYAPGSSGTVTITNTTIVAHPSNATAGMFVADAYTGTFTFDNVVFYGGPYGLRIANDGPGEDYVSLTDVYFVGPFNYGALLFQEVNAPIHITHWENVRYATIENGVLVPGALIPPPLPVEGGGGAGSISINDVTISEGNSGTKVETFTVTRSGGTAAFGVNYATSNGSATVADNDYAAASGTLNFGANENTKTFSVTINGDTKVEGNETFNVGLSNATNGATISDGQGVGTITNDDGAVIAGSVSINDVTISEGNSGTKVATFTATRSGGTAAFGVNYATSNGTATVADNDYAAASGTLNFGANENTKTFSVTINGDTKVEANETFNVVLSNATNGATISDSQGVGTITNDDGAAIAGLVSINDVTISEGNSGTKVETFTVTRSGGTAAFGVNYATSNGTATVADNDYLAASGTLSFGANENTKTISVTINGDTKVEANETFNVVLSNATNGATISDSQGVGTITNDDGAAIAGSVSINDVTISEGNSGTKVETFTVTRSGGTAAFGVNYATSNGSATVGDNDYHAASGTLNFGANENTKTISVTINGDTKVEGNETFNVLLSNATNGATISDGRGVGTITNNDAADTVAPAKPVIASFSTDTGIKGDGITNDHTLSLTGTAEANSMVGVYDGTKLLGTANANSSGAWSYTTGTLVDATYNFTAKATDVAGNTSVASSILAITVTPTALLAGTDGHDVLQPTAAIEDIRGGAGYDYLDFQTSPDRVAIYLQYPQSNQGSLIAGDTISGIEGIFGSPNSDAFVGDQGQNYFYGNAGNDMFQSGGGPLSDHFFGGAGSDRFFFDTHPSYNAPAVIEDFSSGEDLIALSAFFFGNTQTAGHGARPGDAGANVQNGVYALGSEPTLVFNPYTKELSYDADGFMGAAEQVIGIVQTNGLLQSDDFIFV